MPPASGPITSPKAASSVQKVRYLKRVKAQRTGEFLGILVASADWFTDAELLGFCQFRRTWANNIALDFLAVNPRLLQSGEISGVGTALLYRLATVAQKIKARAVWAETSSLSAGYYDKLFGKSPWRDLVASKADLFHATLANLFESGPKQE